MSPSSVCSSKSLRKLLVPTHRVARALDWNKETGSILSLCITRDRIDLAVAAHPHTHVRVQELPSMTVETEIVVDNKKNKKRALKPQISRELSDLINDWAICGLVVHWPVQRDGGWCGAPCGRVLFTLDELAASKAFCNRRFCLWDTSHYYVPCEDSWGRSPIYARATNKTLHVASKEQYVSRPVLVADVWDDFCRSHWPELYYNLEPSSSWSAASASGKLKGGIASRQGQHLVAAIV